MKNKTPRKNITSRLDELIELLEKQLDCIRKSRLDSLEKLTSQTSPLVESLHRDRHFLRAPEHSRKFTKIRKLYSTLVLAAASQSRELSDRLKHIHRGRKTLEKYQDFTGEST